MSLTGSPLSPVEIEKFRATIYSFFDANPRSFPWRRRITPYRVLVSEIMLQQTTVERVVEKFPPFIKRFPCFRALARADQKEVLTAWQGLGYNRRALNLHRAACLVSHNHAGRLPRSSQELITLPGIGAATAAAIVVYAFNQPAVYIETNIRAIYLHHFAPREKDVPDSRLLPFIEATLDRESPARWYSALMDYGVELKKRHGNPARRSKTHTRQPAFSGSLRQARGGALRVLLAASGPLTLAAIAEEANIDRERMSQALTALAREKMVIRQGRRFAIISEPEGVSRLELRGE